MMPTLPVPYNPPPSGSSTGQRMNKAGRVLRRGFEKFSKISKKGKVAVGVGILAGLLSLYSVFKDGAAKGANCAREEMADSYVDLFVKADTSSRYSHLIEKIKEPVAKFMFDNPIYPTYVKTKNFITSVAGEVVNNGVSIAAAGGAIAAPLLLSPPVGTVIGAACAGVLLIKGAHFVLHDVMGFGKKGL